MRKTVWIAAAFVLFAGSVPALPAPSGPPDARRVPGEHWMQFDDPAEAGFDPARLEAAKETWESLPSSAFLVIADGAVVAAWGEIDRRFMCHSVRKSFLSALYGIYWDREAIDLNMTLFDLGIDDTPDPLLDSERQARILDLLKARSGVFHPAAYAGRTDSAPRGSKGAGRYFAYNNWDFNTLATILIEQTGDDVFEAFDRYFGQPLGMQDWRVSDGYYHYERDKSRYPAYPFRMSARDAARFGLLFAREGLWGDDRILSRQWVRRSAALYSIDDDVRGYGFMWWIFREPRFERHGMFAALGVGNQMIAALPDSDIVIVNRANTYQGESTPSADLLDLIEDVLEARTGEAVSRPGLSPIADGPARGVTAVPADELREWAGRWDYPPAPLGLASRSWVEISVGDGHLVTHSPGSGTFKLYLQPDGSWIEEDSLDRYFGIRDDDGAVAGISGTRPIGTAALAATAAGDSRRSARLLQLVEDETDPRLRARRALIALLDGDASGAERTIRELTAEFGPRPVESVLNDDGYGLLGQDRPQAAKSVLELNTRLFPDSSNAWDSLGEAHLAVGETDDAIRCYRRSLELNPDNANAEAALARLAED